MIIVLDGALPSGGSADLRRAARRSRDAWRAAGRPGDLVVEPEDPRATGAEARLVIREAEALVPEGALQGAIAALEQGDVAVATSGFFPGAPPPEEPYATAWELDRVAAYLREQGDSSGEANPGDGAEPAELRRIEGGASHVAARRIRSFVVHSFAGRRAHARPEVLPLIPVVARTLLDVGCGEGALGASLAARGLDVTGVEADPAAAAIASTRLRRVVNASLEESWDELGDRFDTVLACDLLEHLEDPVAALRSLRSRLNESGVLVISVPNASNTAVLAGALMGRWDPALEGVVADDHRTYAGRLGWERILRAGGFRIESWSASLFDPARLSAWKETLAEGGLAAEGLTADELTAVQWLGVARAADEFEPLELGDSGFGAGGLDANDPVGAVTLALSSEASVTHTLFNSTSAAALEALLAADVAVGDSRAALVSGVTRHGLVARFAASGIAVELQPAGEDPIPPAVESLCRTAAFRGLPIEEEGLRTTVWRARFTKENAS